MELFLLHFYWVDGCLSSVFSKSTRIVVKVLTIKIIYKYTEILKFFDTR